MKPKLLPDSLLESYRREFPHLSQPHYYLNHAAFGVLSNQVNRHINRHLDERNHGVIESFMKDQEIIEETRTKIAQLINAPSSDHIAFVTNTSEGLNLIAGGLPWKTGDSVVLNDIEFPSNVYPYTNLRNKGADVRFLKSENGMITADSIIEQLTDTDKLVSVSAVQFLSGYRIDLKALGEACTRQGKWLIVDGIQAAGNSPVDVQEMHIDGFVAGGLKWLMAPMGIGFVYLSRALLDAIRPAYVGWLSVETPWNLFDYEQRLNPTARRFELGGLNVPGIYALHHSLDPFLEIGTDRIHSHLLALTDQIMDTIDIPDAACFTQGSYVERTGIVSFTLPESVNGDALVENLRKQGVTVSHRTGKLRISPHFYNNSDDIKAAVSVINQTVRKNI